MRDFIGWFESINWSRVQWENMGYFFLMSCLGMLFLSIAFMVVRYALTLNCQEWAR